MKKKYLLAPGPTPVPESIALEMAAPMVHHRTPHFSKIFAEAAEDAKLWCGGCAWIYAARYGGPFSRA